MMKRWQIISRGKRDFEFPTATQGVTFHCASDRQGAWVIARVNGQVLSRQVMPTRGYLLQSELPITIGLGESTRLDSLEIR